MRHIRRSARKQASIEWGPPPAQLPYASGCEKHSCEPRSAGSAGDDQPQAVVARTLLADEPDQELAQRQRLGAHGGHGGFQSQVHAHLTTAHPDLKARRSS